MSQKSRNRRSNKKYVQWLSGLFLVLILTGCGNSEDKSLIMNFLDQMMNSYQRDSMPGAKLVYKECLSCHYTNKPLRKVGPSLKGIFGRVPTISGVPYTRWDKAALEQWLADPSGVKPSTTMVIPGIKSEQQRLDIIEYLKKL